jgi:beta-N-acetylhexosaminidase
MIDQEGGRVARLRPPHWRAHPPARAHTSDRAAYLTGALIGLDAAALGLTTVCAPILDTPPPDGHDIIGDRAFSTIPDIVATRATAFAAGLLAAGIQPVGKHAPGHGRATADSHLTLPELDSITEDDLIPFIANRHLPWLMTAHIRYMHQDMHHPATLSPAIIQTIIRGRIGFAGVLVSDDLAMHALTGAPGERAAAAIAAGCDIALHCTGILEESRDVLQSLPPITDAAQTRLAAARAQAQAARIPLDAQTLAAEREALFA